MNENNTVFGSMLKNSSSENALDMKNTDSPPPVNGFTKFKAEEQMTNFEQSTFYQSRQIGSENITGSDRKRGRRSLHDENSLDDILGQCKATVFSSYMFAFDL